jgi:hypothetical protein
MSAPPCSPSSCRHRGRTFLDRELYLPKCFLHVVRLAQARRLEVGDGDVFAATVMV